MSIPEKRIFHKKTKDQIRFLVKLPNIEFELWIIQLLVVELLTEIIIKINYEC